MKVILTEEVPTLGSIGDIVSVKNGYARNYLIPKTLGVVANESNKKELEHQQRILKLKREKVLEQFKAMGKKLQKIKIEVKKQVGEEEKIFGSVTTAEIAQEIAKHKFDFNIDKRSISFDKEIKQTGDYTVNVKLHSEVTVGIKLRVDAL